MKVSNEEFIALLQDRPALWQKSHPDFNNREIRNELLAQIAVVAEADAVECAKKLKNLKDSMRAHVAKLPKTSSGLPAFYLSDQITWPFFKPMLFMKDEFAPRIKPLTLNLEESGSNDTSDIKEDFTHLCKPYDRDEPSGEQGATPNEIPMVNFPSGAETSVRVLDRNRDSFKGGAKRLRVKLPLGLKRRRTFGSDQTEFDEMRPPMLDRQAAISDELDTFARDIANDLRKIKCPLKLIQAKSKIRRVAEDFVISELLPSTNAADTNGSSHSPTTRELSSTSH